jgi:FkbM family methyltransferase
MDHILAYALQHQMAGRLQDAQCLYDSLLQQFPDQPVIKQAMQWLRQPPSEIAPHLAELRGLIAPYYLPTPDCRVANLGSLLEETFGRKNNGTFVDIGTCDGRTASNTEFLASLGWRGLCVEPVPVLFQKSQAWHRGNRGVIVENCAVGAEEGEIDIDHIRTTRFRLETLLERHRLPKTFELLVVNNAEATLDVLASVDLSAWSPRMILIARMDHPLSATIVTQRLSGHGYRERQNDGRMMVFVRDPVVERPTAPPAPTFNVAGLAAAIGNAQNRDTWVAAQLRAIPAESRLLDIGAGECQYAKYCSHLHYTGQDVAVYDGQGDGAGLQMGSWDFRKIELVCDLYDIPEDHPFDAVLCTEVLEHVVDPVRALDKIARVLRPGGTLILTAPFCALTHFAPHFHATGFSSYFYRHHLDRLHFEIVEMSPNGDYFLYLAQEMLRLPDIVRKYLQQSFDAALTDKTLETVAQLIRLSMQERQTETGRARSSELLAFGFHVLARKI